MFDPFHAVGTAGWLLQATPGPGTDWVRLVLQLSDVASGLLGLVIAYIAYRGYRRNQSRPMLFFSTGFVLALGVPLAILGVAVVAPGVPQRALAAVTQFSELLGLACILYALRVRP